MSELSFDASASREALLSVVNQSIAKGDWSEVSGACSAFLDQQDDPKATSVYAEANYIQAICRFLDDDLAEAVGFGLNALEADSNVSEYADFLAVLHVLVGDLTKSVFYAKLASSVPSVPELKNLLPKSFPNLSSAFIEIEDEPLLNRAVVAVSSKKWDVAAHWFSQNIRFNPADKKSFLGLANCLTVMGRYQEAVDIMRGAMHRLGEDAEIASKLGSLLAMTNEYAQSKAVHRWAMELDSENASVHASAITDLAMSPDASAQTLTDLSKEWGKRFGIQDDGFGESQAVEKPVLTVGYMLGTVSRRAEGGVLAKILANRDSNRFRTVGFGHGNLSDAGNVHYQKAFDVWHDVREMDPTTLGAISFAEGLDIFIDVAGFSDPEMLIAFGARMAPMQVSLGSVPYGSGLANMDFRMTSKILDDEELAVENPVYLEHGVQLVDVPEIGTEVTIQREDQSLTFGVDSELCELTPQSAEWWAEILLKHPDSMLLLNDHDFENATNLTKIINLFGNFGVSHRVDIIRSATQAEFYSQIDILLVPKTGNQNRNIVSASLLGVPVVCSMGSHSLTRSAADILHQMGAAEDSVASDRKEYVALASQWGAKVEERKAMRETAREKVMNSPLFDFKLRCAEIESSLNALWKNACGSA